MILVILFKFRASVASDINLLITLHVYVMLTSVRQTASAPDSKPRLSKSSIFFWLAKIRKPSEGQCLYFNILKKNRDHFDASSSDSLIFNPDIKHNLKLYLIENNKKWSFKNISCFKNWADVGLKSFEFKG